VVVERTQDPSAESDRQQLRMVVNCKDLVQLLHLEPLTHLVDRRCTTGGGNASRSKGFLSHFLRCGAVGERRVLAVLVRRALIAHRTRRLKEFPSVVQEAAVTAAVVLVAVDKRLGRESTALMYQ
jgi:hypothetical protein